MKQHRKTSIIVGILFIIATVTSSIGFVILEPILNASNIFTNVSANAIQLIIGVLFLLVNCVAVILIPAMLFPVFKKHNEPLALGYFGFRITESVTLIVGGIILLPLLTLSQEYVQTAVLNVSYLQTLGSLLLAVSDWFLLFSIGIIFSLGVLILNYILYKSKLVPRWISLWGIIGAKLYLAVSLLEIFGFIVGGDIVALPIAVQEMVFAVWLIVKGFNLSAINSKSTKTK